MTSISDDLLRKVHYLARILVRHAEKPIPPEITHVPFCPPLKRFTASLHEAPRHATDADPSGWRPLGEQAIKQFLGDTCGWLKANPSFPRARAKVQESYLGLPHDARVPHTLHPIANQKLKPVQGDGYVFDLILKSPSTRCAVLRGRRGSGKTAFMNYWLVRNSDRLEFFRIDVTKIYDLIDKQPAWLEDDKLLMKYHAQHACYVMFFYSGMLDELWAPAGETYEKNEHFIGFLQSCNSGEAAEHVAKALDLFKRAITNVGFSGLDPSVSINKELFRLCSEETYTNTISPLFDRLIEYLSKNKRHVVFAVDGADNVSWSRRNSHYEKICRKVGRFIVDSLARKNGPIKIILASRPESFPIIREGMLGDGYSGPPIPDIDHYDIAPPSPLQLLNYRISQARTSDAFADDRAATLSKLCSLTTATEATAFFSEQLEQTLRAAETYAEHIFTSIVAMYRTTQGVGQRYLRREDLEDADATDRSGQVLETLFEGNVRAFIDNFFNFLRVKSAMANLRAVPESFDSR